MHLNDYDSFINIKNKINKCINNSELLSSNLIAKYYGNKDNNKKKLDNPGVISFIIKGDLPVGKTAFFQRFQDIIFQKESLMTIGIDKEIRYFQIQNDFYKVTLWDTGVRMKFPPKKLINTNLDGILILYDINDENSFDNIPKLFEDIKENINNYEDFKDRIYLLGNKIDLDERIISKEKAEDFAKSYGFKYFEISCKIDMNISEIINKIILESYKSKNHLNKINKINNLKKKIKISKINTLNKYYSY